MIKVLTAALVGTIIGIIVMVVVIALSGTDTSGASSVGLGSLPVSTYSASSSSSTSSSTPTSGGSSSSSGGGVSGDANAGKAVFTSAGCAGCHTLSQAGATGAVGPNLNTAIKGDAGSTPLAAFIKESIVNPDKVIAKGYTAGVMPSNFGSTLSSSDINNLVALIMSGQ
ncbi:MAG TPA: cytochrome c [Gaiellales bacterium]|nr:cytochrome c [Gaiellales bacterium]